MRLTFEEAENARAILAEHERLPVRILSETLAKGKFERVARVSATFFNRREPRAGLFYVLALIQSGHPDDLRLARDLLCKMEGKLPISSPKSLMEAARWVLRLDLPGFEDHPIFDAGQRLLDLARIHHALEDSHSQKDDKEFSSLLSETCERTVSLEEAQAFHAMRAIRRGEIENAFRVLRGIQRTTSPYFRLAAHQLYSILSQKRGLEVLCYDKHKRVRALGIRIIPEIGLIWKEYTGKGYERSSSGEPFGGPRSAVAFAMPEDLLKRLREGKLGMERLLGKSRTLADLQWTPAVKALPGC